MTRNYDVIIKINDTLIVFNIASEKAAPHRIRFAAAKLLRSMIFLTVES